MDQIVPQIRPLPPPSTSFRIHLSLSPMQLPVLSYYATESLHSCVEEKQFRQNMCGPTNKKESCARIYEYMSSACSTARQRERVLYCLPTAGSCDVGCVSSETLAGFLELMSLRLNDRSSFTDFREITWRCSSVPLTQKPMERHGPMISIPTRCSGSPGFRSQSVDYLSQVLHVGFGLPQRYYLGVV